MRSALLSPGWLFVALITATLASGVCAQDEDVPSTPPAVPHATGLLLGSYNPGEAIAETDQEKTLGLRPHPGMSQIRPFWLYVPSMYRQGEAAPLVIALHPRGRLRSFSTRVRFTESHLRNAAQTTLEAWRGLAERQGFLLLVPLGDPDVLWMGMSWFPGDRSRLIETQIDTVSATHSVNPARIYIVAAGEGAHAAIATGVRRGDLVTAVVACNPPLFDTASITDGVVYPETVEEIITHTGPRRPPVLVLAGDRDGIMKIHKHTVSTLRVTRYQDSSSIPAEHLRQMTDKLSAGGVATEFRTIPTKHFAPLPADQVAAVWYWLTHHRNEHAGAAEQEHPAAAVSSAPRSDPPPSQGGAGGGS